VYRKHRIEQMGKMYPQGFGDLAKRGPITIETPGTAHLDNLQARHVMRLCIRDMQEKYVVENNSEEGKAPPKA